MSFTKQNIRAGAMKKKVQKKKKLARMIPSNVWDENEDFLTLRTTRGIISRTSDGLKESKGRMIESSVLTQIVRLSNNQVIEPGMTYFLKISNEKCSNVQLSKRLENMCDFKLSGRELILTCAEYGFITNSTFDYATFETRSVIDKPMFQ